MKLIQFICSKMHCALFSCGVAFLFSLTALSMAFASEAFLGLEPCILCIYQRYPYAIVIVLALLGMVFRKNGKAAPIALALCSITFLANSIIAAYHSGVERHWWKSFSESCAIFQFDDPNKSVLENLLSTPMGHCDEIAWADPVFGFSMANYNIIFCLILCAFCAIASFKQFKTRQNCAE